MNRPGHASILHLHGFDPSGEDYGQWRHRIRHQEDLFAGDAELAVSSAFWWHEAAIARALSARLLVVHAAASAAFEGLVLERRRRGLASLVEIGDDHAARASWRSRRPQRGPLELQQVWYLATLADAVQFSSPALEQRYRALSPVRQVLPNSVAFPPAPPRKAAGFHIGWGGTRSHRADLERIAPAVAAFVRAHDDVVLHLKGNPDMLAGVFADVPADRRRIEPFGDYDGYCRFLDRLHVGLAPLGPSAFNLGRTDVKLAEFAAAGALPLAEAAPAYLEHADIVPMFDSSASLAAMLEALHADRAGLAARARAVFAHFDGLRGPEPVRRSVRTWYLSRCTGAGAGAPDIADGAAERLARMQRIRAARRGGDLATAHDLAAGLLADCPGHRQARWELTGLLAQAGAADAALETGAPLADCPAHGDAYLTLRLRHRPGEAGDLLPAFRSDWRRLLAMPAGRMDSAELHARRLQANPWDWFALRLTARRQDLPAAERAQVAARIALFTPDAAIRAAECGLGSGDSTATMTSRQEAPPE